jgi:hypothetical protein
MTQSGKAPLPHLATLTQKEAQLFGQKMGGLSMEESVHENGVSLPLVRDHGRTRLRHQYVRTLLYLVLSSFLLYQYNMLHGSIL